MEQQAAARYERQQGKVRIFLQLRQQHGMAVRGADPRAVKDNGNGINTFQNRKGLLQDVAAAFYDRGKDGRKKETTH